MKSISLLVSGLILAGAHASVLPSGASVGTVKRHTLGTKWNKREALDPDTTIPVRIALKQQNMDKGMDYLMEVSDPSSPKYRQYYTADQVVDLFAPKDETVATVSQWLVKSGVSEKTITIPKSKGWLDFTTTVANLESLVQGKYHTYSRDDGTGHQITSETYVLPADVEDHIEFIAPATAPAASNKKLRAVARSSRGSKYASGSASSAKSATVPLDKVKKLTENLADTQNCSSYVTIECIRALYKIPQSSSSAPGNSLGLYQEDQEFPRRVDLKSFFTQFAPEVPPDTFPKVNSIDFGDNPANGSGFTVEASPDFELVVPLIYPQSTVLYSTSTNFRSPNNTRGLFNQFLDAVDGSYCTESSYGETGDNPDVDGITPNEQCGTLKPTNVISFSYGWAEAEYPAGYQKRQCDEFLKLGLQGTTIVFSSGDGGVAGGHGDDCLGTDKSIFNPQSAAVCPYVTAVGGTALPPGGKPGDAEQATISFGGGGGFSNVFTAPKYQKSALQEYFQHNDPGFPSYSTSDGKIPAAGHGVYNKAGRGYPDVAAIADNIVTVIYETVQTIGGTSAAAPIMASIFNLINEELIAAGKPVIGFANPALYANPGMFNDIKAGNQSAGGHGDCLGKSFKATPGWDPVTGLGTPNYPALLKYFTEL